MKKQITLLLGVLLTFALMGCQSPPRTDTPTNLTFGAVKSKIKKGQTTQTEIISLLGSPNITSKSKDGNEVWTYAKQSSRTEDTSASAGGGLLGLGSAVLGGIVGGASKAVSTSSVNTFDLIIIFDKNDIVKDYSVIASKF